MTDEIRQFVHEILTRMNYSLDGVDDDTVLGPAGVDLESLAFAELALRLEERFGVNLTEEDAEEMAGMTIGEFCLEMEDRIQSASAR